MIMAEYIDRRALLSDLGYLAPGYGTHVLFYPHTEVKETILKQPVVDVRPAMHGKWMETMVVGGFAESWESTCSICGKSWRDIGKPNYCPNCGARMEG